MDDRLLVYGATGYTGKLIARAAVKAGLSVVLGGRNEGRLRTLASELSVEFRTAEVEDGRALDRLLGGIRTLLNASGPFRATAPRLIEACVRHGIHYLDITGEAAIIEEASARDGDAKRQGIMIMPAVGFDVVASDCLACHVARRSGLPARLFVGISGLELLTPGSAKTIIAEVGAPVLVRRSGALTAVHSWSIERSFDYGSGPRQSVAVTWGDVVSGYFSTGIPDITVYFEATPAVRTHHVFVGLFGQTVPLGPWRKLLDVASEWLPQGPSEEERRGRHAVIVAEVEDASGRVVRSRMRTPEAYSMTEWTATTIATRVLQGDFRAGFQTPGRVYGPDFPLSLPGVEREDL
jgi:short subunit dehydrogenase-like uncharacterized protein